MVWGNLKGELRPSAGGLFLAVDKRLSITGVSPELCRLLASCEERLLGRSLFDAFEFESTSFLEALLAGERPVGQSPELRATFAQAKRELVFGLDATGTPLRGYVFKVLRHQLARSFVQQDCDYEVEVQGGRVFKLLRVAFVGGSACEQEFAGRKCFDVVCGRPATCERCPALAVIEQPIGDELSVVRQQGNLFEISTAKRVGLNRVQVRARHMSSGHLRQVREARINQLANNAALSKREHEVLEHILLGAPLEEIGQKLGISARTVKFHQANLLAKLGADSRVDLLRVLA